jgi:CheY-like chemotaxis protein
MPPETVPPPQADAEAVSDLLAAAHDLRAPLDTLSALVIELRDEPLTETGRGHLATIEAMIAHLRLVATSLLDQGGRVAPIVFAPRDWFSAIAEAAHARARRDGVDFEHSMTDLPAFAMGQPTALRRAVENLLDNAFRHGKAVRLAAMAENGRLTIRVRDDGPGIAEGDQAGLFAPFSRLAQDRTIRARSTDGAGLGLWLVRGIARRLGGDVTLSSAPGAGAEFTLTVPLAPSDAPAPPVAATPRSVPRRLILVVDDNVYGRLMLRRLLEALGEAVVEADGVATALAAVTAHQPDGVLMDIEMPDGGGLAALAAVRASDGNTSLPVIAVSARGEVGRPAALAAGFTDYLVKPVEPARLAEALATLAPRRDPPVAPL